MSAKDLVREIFANAEIEINGKNPWDLKVHDERFYKRVISQGSLGLGEAYMDGWWDCGELDEMFYRVLIYGAREKIKPNLAIYFAFVKSQLFNMQNRTRSKKVAEDHYDLPTEIYMSFLDSYNQYTSARFECQENFDTAQEQTLELICRKIQIKSSDKVLDIGCGWGGAAKYMAEHYGCSVVGVSISNAQIDYARSYCKGLPVEIKYCDYRDLIPEFCGKFSKVLVRGMIEHVGYKNYRKFMNVIHCCLDSRADSLFLLDALGGNFTRKTSDPWISKYIFPNSMVPALTPVAKAIEGLFVLEDLHNFSISYDKTLLHWRANFVRNWPDTKTKLDERPYYDYTLASWVRILGGRDWESLREEYHQRFFRKFVYYFLACAAGFRARHLQQWQFVLSKGGVPGGYHATQRMPVNP